MSNISSKANDPNVSKVHVEPAGVVTTNMIVFKPSRSHDQYVHHINGKKV